VAAATPSTTYVPSCARRHAHTPSKLNALTTTLIPASRAHPFHGFQAKIKLSYREFLKVLLKVADGAYPASGPPERVTSLLGAMEGSGHFGRVADAEGGGALAAAPTPMRSMPPLPPDTPAGPCPNCSRSADEALAAAAKARDLAFQLQRAEATSAADQRRVASLEGQLRSLEDERRSSTAAGLGSQSDADRYRRKLAEAEGALAAAESRISLLEGSARRDQQQMEGTTDGRTWLPCPPPLSPPPHGRRPCPAPAYRHQPAVR